MKQILITKHRPLTSLICLATIHLKKGIILLLFFQLIFYFADAQTTVKGTVTNMNGEALSLEPLVEQNPGY